MFKIVIMTVNDSTLVNECNYYFNRGEVFFVHRLQNIIVKSNKCVAMVITRDVTLPEEAALTVPEVDLSMATLLSAAPYLGKACEAVNNEFMLCRYETRDPRACLDLGKKVTACTLDFFRSVKCSCLKEFNQYAHCVEKSSGDYSFSKCRKTQAVFDGCMEEKMGMVRPDFGYFTRARVHCTQRPAPEPEPPADFPDATPAVPDSMPRQYPRFGGRFYWMTE